jgi:hypothetical protein
MIVDFLPSHLLEMELQPAQQDMKPWLDKVGVFYGQNGPCRSVLSDDGRVILCCGLLPMVIPGISIAPSVAVAWVIAAKMNKGEFLHCHNAVRELLEDYGSRFERIEAYVDLDFKDGHRWMKSLGFECEAPLRKKAGFMGRDDTLYAKMMGG